MVSPRVATSTHSISGGVEPDEHERETSRSRRQGREPGAGAILGGKYRLISEIGRGGMGSVWRAENLAWEAPVALKLMSSELSNASEALSRFEREVRLAAGLRSPHVVQVLDHGVDEATRTPFIVMELLEGETLARRLKHVGHLGAAETFQIVSHLVRALSRAHAAGIVHRDLKPDNVFLVRNEEESLAKVLDFGVAKWTSPSRLDGGLTRPGSVIGTPFYMSPEQIQGSREIDHRADLWSLSAIACECLTGRRPFEADDFAQLAVMLVGNSGRPLPSSLGAVPMGFDAWFLRATAADISRRFQTARELLDTLAPICGVSVTSLAPDSFPVTEELRASGPASMAAVSNTASPSPIPRQLWRRPAARVMAWTLLSFAVVAGSAALLRHESSNDAGTEAEATRQSLQPGPVTHAPNGAASSGGGAVLKEPVGAVPGIRVVHEPGPTSSSDARIELGIPPRFSEPGESNELGARDQRGHVGTGQRPEEVEDLGAIGDERDSIAAAPRPHAGKSKRPPKRNTAVGLAARPTSAGVRHEAAGKVTTHAPPADEPAPDDVDVNGRRIRTSLTLTP